MPVTHFVPIATKQASKKKQVNTASSSYHKKSKHALHRSALRSCSLMHGCPDTGCTSYFIILLLAIILVLEWLLYYYIVVLAS